LVFPEGDGKDFVCFGCAAVGKTFQAVDSHRNSHFHRIEQKQRPTECALCSVSDGVHAMYPLFDYHGKGGRQICYTKRSKNKNGSNEKILAWGHALCCLYLASVDFMYACYKDGDYIGIEEEEEKDPDTRPPNPELKVTNEFRRMYGDAMPHFRYYMTPPTGDLDPWTTAVHTNQKNLKCIECGLLDHKNSMRIPLQCVANDADEYREHKHKHRLRNNDSHPCTQALHVGCARWKDPSSKVRKCYYFPGLTNSDGTIRDNIDTVHCLYCKTHAENVDERFQNKKLKREQQKRRQQHGSMQPLKGSQKAAQSISKRPASMMTGTNYLSKNKKHAPLVAVPKASRGWGKYKNKDAERYKELDPSVSVPINAGQQPKLATRRREIANERSIVSKGDLNRIFDNLVHHKHEIAKNASLGINGRKRYWKHKFSGLSTKDFDNVWSAALEKFRKMNRNIDASKSNTSTGKNERALGQVGSASVDLTFLDSDDEEDATLSKRDKNTGKKKKKKVRPKTGYGRGNDSAIEIEADNGGGFDASGDEETGSIGDGTNNKNVSKNKEKQKQSTERPPDRWSKLFIGQSFEMGCEFTLDVFEEKL